MNSKISIVVLLLILSLGCAPKKEKDVAQNTGTEKVETSRTLDNPFFVFNNSMNKKDVKPMTLEEQATLVKQLGFDGMEFKEADGLPEAIKIFNENGLKVYTDYMQIDIDKDEPYSPQWKEVIPKLKGSDIILWVHIHSEKHEPSDESADELVVPVLQELADLAEPYGVRIAIYPHVGFLAQKVEDSYRLANKADRDNVGSVFNLCHFLKTDDGENLESVIDRTFPKLFAVSISGADRVDTKNMDWDRLIQPVGEGNFDVYRVVELLADKGYEGPIGIQCYNLKGQPETYLKTTAASIKKFKEKYEKPENQLSEREKANGWKLLFDGKSMEQWRGINKDYFPKSGWKVEDGLLVASFEGGGESESGGDIITKKKYGDFVLKWDWKMVSKGGNSGLKYYVQEGLGENEGYGFGLEYQILDDKNHEWMLNGKMKPNDYHTVGSVYEIYPASPDKRPSPLGLWNTSEIVSKDNHVEHWLNGQKILEYDRGSSDFKGKIAESKFKDVKGYGTIPKGYLLLQDHGSVVNYRNIKVKEIKLKILICSSPLYFTYELNFYDRTTNEPISMAHMCLALFCHHHQLSRSPCAEYPCAPVAGRLWVVGNRLWVYRYSVSGGLRYRCHNHGPFTRQVRGTFDLFDRHRDMEPCRNGACLCT